MEKNTKYPVAMDQLLIMAVEQKASDVHIVSMDRPMFRVNQTMSKLDFCGWAESEKSIGILMNGSG